MVRGEEGGSRASEDLMFVTSDIMASMSVAVSSLLL